MRKLFSRLGVEAVRFVIFGAVILYGYQRVTDSIQIADASSSQIEKKQHDLNRRLSDLEREQLDSQVEFVHQVSEVKDELISHSADWESQQEALAALISTNSSELKSLVEAHIDRIEGETLVTAKQVSARVEDIESRLSRQTLSMKQKMIYPVVQLRGNGTVGSGVVVYSDLDQNGDGLTYILTAYHVVQEVTEGQEDPTQINELRFLDPATDRLANTHESAKVVAFEADSDIALLEMKTLRPWPYVARFATISETEEAEIFDGVYAVGCPLGNKPLPTLGEISSQEKMVAGQNFWMLNAPTFFGNSGGGVFQVSNGHLLGISSMIYTYGKSQPMVVPHMGLFVPMTQLRHWLTEEGYAMLLDENRVQTVRASHETDSTQGK